MCRLALMNRAILWKLTPDKLTDILKAYEKANGGDGNGIAIFSNKKFTDIPDSAEWFRDNYYHILLWKGQKVSVEKMPALIYSHIDSIDWIIFHTRKASVGKKTDENTHPFYQKGLVLAMNGTEKWTKELRDKIFDNPEMTDTEVILQILTRLKQYRKPSSIMSWLIRHTESVWLGYKSGQFFVINMGRGDLMPYIGKNGEVYIASEIPKEFETELKGEKGFIWTNLHGVVNEGEWKTHRKIWGDSAMTDSKKKAYYYFHIIKNGKTVSSYGMYGELLVSIDKPLRIKNYLDRPIEVIPPTIRMRGVVEVVVKREGVRYMKVRLYDGDIISYEYYGKGKVVKKSEKKERKKSSNENSQNEKSREKHSSVALTYYGTNGDVLLHTMGKFYSGGDFEKKVSEQVKEIVKNGHWVTKLKVRFTETEAVEFAIWEIDWIYSHGIPEEFRLGKLLEVKFRNDYEHFKGNMIDLYEIDPKLHHKKFVQTYRAKNLYLFWNRKRATVGLVNFDEYSYLLLPKDSKLYRIILRSGKHLKVTRIVDTRDGEILFEWGQN